MTIAADVPAAFRRRGGIPDAYGWDDLASVLELTGDARHRHIPGSPMDYEHEYVPLTAAAAKSHFKGSVPKSWAPKGGKAAPAGKDPGAAMARFRALRVQAKDAEPHDFEKAAGLYEKAAAELPAGHSARAALEDRAASLRARAPEDKRVREELKAGKGAPGADAAVRAANAERAKGAVVKGGQFETGHSVADALTRAARTGKAHYVVPTSVGMQVSTEGNPVGGHIRVDPSGEVSQWDYRRGEHSKASVMPDAAVQSLLSRHLSKTAYVAPPASASGPAARKRKDIARAVKDIQANPKMQTPEILQKLRGIAASSGSLDLIPAEWGLAYGWDDLASAIALTGDANHIHIPGSPYEWRHPYVPLAESAARSHGHGKVPRGWKAPSGGGAGKGAPSGHAQEARSLAADARKMPSGSGRTQRAAGHLDAAAAHLDAGNGGEARKDLSAARKEMLLHAQDVKGFRLTGLAEGGNTGSPARIAKANALAGRADKLHGEVMHEQIVSAKVAGTKVTDWGQLRQGSADDLKPGDQFFNAGMGSRIAVAKDGSVREIGGAGALTPHGVTWTVSKRDGNTVTAVGDNGKTLTQDIPAGRKVLKVTSPIAAEKPAAVPKASRAPRVSKAADKLTVAAKPSVTAKAMPAGDLKAADQELARRAALLGKPGQQSKAHKAVTAEIAKRAAAGNAARPNTIVQPDPVTGNLREMTQKETAEAAGRYAQTLRPGSAERAEIERQALDIARGGPTWQRMKEDADALRPLIGKTGAPGSPKPDKELSFFEVQNAYQAAHGRPAPKSVLRSWAFNGPSGQDKRSAWYQAGVTRKGEMQAQGSLRARLLDARPDEAKAKEAAAEASARADIKAVQQSGSRAAAAARAAATAKPKAPRAPRVAAPKKSAADRLGLISERMGGADKTSGDMQAGDMLQGHQAISQAPAGIIGGTSDPWWMAGPNGSFGLSVKGSDGQRQFIPWGAEKQKEAEAAAVKAVNQHNRYGVGYGSGYQQVLAKAVASRAHYQQLGFARTWDDLSSVIDLAVRAPAKAPAAKAKMARSGLTPGSSPVSRGAAPAGQRQAPASLAAPGPSRRGRQVPLTPMRQAAAKSMRKLAASVQESHPDMTVHDHLRDAARTLESGQEEASQRHLRAAMFALTPQSLMRNGLHTDEHHMAGRQVMHSVHRHLLLVKDITDVAAKNQAAIRRLGGEDDTAPRPAADPNNGYGPGALAQKPTARQPPGDQALNAPNRSSSGGSDPAVADPDGPQRPGSKQFARTWDGLSRALEFASSGGHHVAGTGYDWKHEYVPLTEAAARSHGHGKVPKSWHAPSGGGGKSARSGVVRKAVAAEVKRRGITRSPVTEAPAEPDRAEAARHHADWMKAGNFQDSKDSTTGYKTSSLGQTSDFGATVHERHASGGPWASNAKAYDWNIGRQRTEREGPDAYGSWSEGPLATGTEPTMAKARSTALKAMRQARAAHIAAGGDVGYGDAPTGAEIRAATGMTAGKNVLRVTGPPPAPDGTPKPKAPDRAAAVAQRKMDRTVKARDDMEQAYQQANAAYQAALQRATGSDGSFNPRSPEAQEAERLRQPMLNAKAAAAKARMALLAQLQSGSTSHLAYGWDDLDGVLEFSARTAQLEVTPAPIGKPGGPGLYHVKGLGHSAYFEQVRNGLMKRGIPEGTAHAMTWGILRRWAAGGGKVHPEVRAAAVKALAEEKAKAAAAHAHSVTRDDVAGAITLTGDARHHHIPGSPMDYEHGWNPLTPVAAKSHFKGSVPKGWKAPKGHGGGTGASAGRSGVSAAVTRARQAIAARVAADKDIPDWEPSRKAAGEAAGALSALDALDRESSGDSSVKALAAHAQAFHESMEPRFGGGGNLSRDPAVQAARDDLMKAVTGQQEDIAVRHLSPSARHLVMTDPLQGGTSYHDVRDTGTLRAYAQQAALRGYDVKEAGGPADLPGMPKGAQQLIRHARANGWNTSVYASQDSDGKPGYKVLATNPEKKLTSEQSYMRGQRSTYSAEPVSASLDRITRSPREQYADSGAATGAARSAADARSLAADMRRGTATGSPEHTAAKNLAAAAKGIGAGRGGVLQAQTARDHLAAQLQALTEELARNAGRPGYYAADTNRRIERTQGLLNRADALLSSLQSGSGGQAAGLAYSWDDLAGVLDLAAAQPAAGSTAASSSSGAVPARVPAGQAGGGQFGSGSGQPAKGKPDAHQQHVAHVAHVAQVSTAKAALMATAADDRQKAAGLITQRNALQKALASAGGKVSSGQAGAKTATTAKTKSTAPATAGTAAAPAASTTTAKAPAAAKTPAKAATTAAPGTAAAKATAAQLTQQIGALTQQINGLLAAAKQATAQAAALK